MNEIIQYNSFIKDMRIDKSGAPFGLLISSKKLEYDEKITNINYSLKLKIIFVILS